MQDRVPSALPSGHTGGIALGPKPRDYSYSLNRKVKRLAIKSAFSTKALEENIIVVDNIDVTEYKTKTVVAMLKALGAEKKALIVMPEKNEQFIKSAANIPGVKTALVNTLNTYDVLNAGKFIIAKDAVAKLEVVYA